LGGATFTSVPRCEWKGNKAGEAIEDEFSIMWIGSKEMTKKTATKTYSKRSTVTARDGEMSEQEGTDIADTAIDAL
jgi:hypothetical protein